MGLDQLPCPGCAGQLSVSPVEGLRHYVCTSCGGTVITIAALRQLAAPFAQEIWTGPEAPPAGAGPARCPFCSRPMEPKQVPAGAGAVCRPCEAIWLDKQAADAVTVKPVAAPAGQPTLSSEALRCQECGAPLTNSWEEKCPYCGAAVHAPTQVVLLPVPAGPGEGPAEDWTAPHRPGQRSLLSELGHLLDGRP